LVREKLSLVKMEPTRILVGDLIPFLGIRHGIGIHCDQHWLYSCVISLKPIVSFCSYCWHVIDLINIGLISSWTFNLFIVLLYLRLCISVVKYNHSWSCFIIPWQSIKWACCFEVMYKHYAHRSKLPLAKCKFPL